MFQLTTQKNWSTRYECIASKYENSDFRKKKKYKHTLKYDTPFKFSVHMLMVLFSGIEFDCCSNYVWYRPPVNAITQTRTKPSVLMVWQDREKKWTTRDRSGFLMFYSHAHPKYIYNANCPSKMFYVNCNRFQLFVWPRGFFEKTAFLECGFAWLKFLKTIFKLYNSIFLWYLIAIEQIN